VRVRLAQLGHILFYGNQVQIEQFLARFRHIFRPASAAYFTWARGASFASCGAVSEGETIEEAREMVLDAARELIAYCQEKGSHTAG
jgi:hypothetical protein